MKDVLLLVNLDGSNTLVFFDKVEEIRLVHLIEIRFMSGGIAYYPYDGEYFDNLDAIARMLDAKKEDLVKSSPIVGGN